MAPMASLTTRRLFILASELDSEGQGCKLLKKSAMYVIYIKMPALHQICTEGSREDISNILPLQSSAHSGYVRVLYWS